MYVDMIEKLLFLESQPDTLHGCTLQIHRMNMCKSTSLFCFLGCVPAIAVASLPRRLPSLQSFGGKESMGTFQGDRSSSLSKCQHCSVVFSSWIPSPYI